MRRIPSALRKAVITHPGLFLGKWCLRTPVRRLVSFQRAFFMPDSGQRFSRNSCKNDELRNCVFQRRAHTISWKSRLIICFFPGLTEHLQERNGVVSPPVTSPSPFSAPCLPPGSWATKPCSQLVKRLEQLHKWKKIWNKRGQLNCSNQTFFSSAGSSGVLRGKELFSQALWLLIRHKAGSRLI